MPKKFLSNFCTVVPRRYATPNYSIFEATLFWIGSRIFLDSIAQDIYYIKQTPELRYFSSYIPYFEIEQDIYYIKQTPT